MQSVTLEKCKIYVIIIPSQALSSCECIVYAASRLGDELNLINFRKYNVTKCYTVRGVLRNHSAGSVQNSSVVAQFQCRAVVITVFNIRKASASINSFDILINSK